MLNLEILSEIEEIRRIKHDWSNLLRNSNTGNVFVSWEWVETWWEHFGSKKKLCVFLVREVKEIVGIAPFMISEDKRKGIEMRCLSFIGQSGSGLCPDHVDIIAKRGYENEVADNVVNTILAKNYGWDKILFSGIAQDSIFYNLLITKLGRNKIRYYSGVSSKSPFVMLPPKKNEKKWEYYQRRLSKHGDIKMESLSGKDDLIYGLDIVKKLLINSAERNNRDSDWNDDNYYTFHKDLSYKLTNVNSISIAILYCNNIPISVLYGFIDKYKYLLYSTGFDSNYATFSVGQILIGMFSNYLFEQGIATEFDFLRGDEDYKYRWTDMDRMNHFVYFYGKNLKGMFINSIEVAYRNYRMIVHHDT